MASQVDMEVNEVPPLVVNNGTHPVGEAALTGGFCRVVDGPFVGRYGVFVSTAASDANGLPITVVFRSRDEHDEYLTVDYAHLVRADAGGR